jgi:hypothetical protein
MLASCREILSTRAGGILEQTVLISTEVGALCKIKDLIYMQIAVFTNSLTLCHTSKVTSSFYLPAMT